MFRVSPLTQKSHTYVCISTCRKLHGCRYVIEIHGSILRDEKEREREKEHDNFRTNFCLITRPQLTSYEWHEIFRKQVFFG